MPKGVYKHKSGWKHSIETRSKISKSHTGKVHSNEHNESICLARLGTHLSEETKRKIGVSQLGRVSGMRGKKHSAESKQKIGDAGRGSNNPNFGKHFSDEHIRRLSESHKGNKLSVDAKRKLRVFALNRVAKQGRLCQGKNETALLDEQERKDGVKILRQWNTKIGYQVDGYCPETNTVYEVYEKYHDKRVQKDLERETEICNRFGCDFIIIWDRR